MPSGTAEALMMALRGTVTLPCKDSAFSSAVSSTVTVSS